MVVTCLPSAALTGMTQERIATPSRCTVQAPHCAIPHPYLVPVRPTCSRITHSRGVLGLTLTSTDLPLTVKRAIAIPPPSLVLELSALTHLRASIRAAALHALQGVQAPATGLAPIFLGGRPPSYPAGTSR